MSLLEWLKKIVGLFSNKYSSVLSYDSTITNNRLAFLLAAVLPCEDGADIYVSPFANHVRPQSFYEIVLWLLIRTLSDFAAIERGRALRQGPFCFLQLLYKGTKGSVGCRSPPSVLVCQQTKMEGHE